MFILSKKLLIKRIALASVCVALLFVAAFVVVKQVQRSVSASTADGEVVHVAIGEEIYYGGPSSNQWVTHKYTITNGSGQPFQAMCAEPIKAGPGDGVWFSNVIDMNELRFKQIKLMMYIYFNQSDPAVGVDGSGVNLNKAFLNSIMSDTDENLRFAYTHSLIGYFYSGDTTGLMPGQITWAANVQDYLTSLINTNDIRWQVAQNYNLHMTTGDNIFQRIAWIEAAPIQYGKIIVNKTDSDTGSCTNTTGNLSLNGTTFALVNSSNVTVATKTIANGCSVEFENITYGSYTIVETNAANGYAADAQQKAVTLNASSVSVSMSNTPLKGKIIINKTDSDTGTCAASSNLSLAGTQFTLVNSTGGPVKYGGQSYANGVAIATKTIANGACGVEFDGLPYGKYTVNESSASTGYTADVASKEVTLSGASATVSFSNTPTKYKITVNKIDAETGSCTNTAALSFAGIRFTVVNKTGGPVKYNGNIIANGENIDSKTLSSNSCSVEFSGLPNGQYTIKESSVTAGYSGDVDKNVTIVNGNQEVTFSNTPLKGKIVVNKTDSNTGTCAPTGNLSLVGTQFVLINSTGGAIKVSGQTYANGATVATKSIAENSCGVEFDGLPYGKYTIREASASAGYTADVTSKDVTLSGASATISFSNTSVKGKITVSKKDSGTGTCTTQGNASFNGTKFELTNNSTNAVYYGGRSIARGAVIDTKTLSDGACEVTFNDLPYGTYAVKEIAVGTGYTIDSTVKTINIPTNNNVNVSTSFANDPILGSITVNKIDSTTGTCTTTGKLSFNGVTFTVTNNSNNPVIYGGNSYAKGGVIATKSLANDACNVKFENLPYGEYIVKETRVSEGYVRNTGSFTVNIPTDNSVNVSTTVPNDPIRGDVKFVKYDENNEEAMSNVVFSISAVDENDQIKETHIVVSDENGVVDTSSSFALHSVNTNGYDALYDGPDEVVFAGFGTWFGLDNNGNAIAPQDGLGALPYGTYIIQELKCGANLFCIGTLNEKATITINSNNQVIDLGNWNNNCTKFSLDTVATDGVDDDKYIEVNGQATLKDTIDYCVTPNLDFVIKGILMVKETGEPLTVNGETVENQINVRSSEGCGTTEMVFEFDASELGGKTLVVFESLYYVNEFDAHLITEHKDINDDDQSVDVISLTTLATNEATGEKTLPVDSDAIIKDVVNYCLRPGVEYTLKGILMDGKTMNAALSNSKTVEKEVKFTPTEACGTFDVLYEVNTKELAGRKLIIFDSLYIDDELILEHKDFNNENETVVVDLPAPDTGFMTRAFGGGIQVFAPVVGAFAGAIIFVFYRRVRRANKMTFDKK